MNLRKSLFLLCSLVSCSVTTQKDKNQNEQPKQETPIVLTFEERLDLSEQICNIAKSQGYKVITSATNDGILIKSYDDLAKIKNKSIALLDIYNLISSNLTKPVRVFKAYKTDHSASEMVHLKPYMYYFYWGAAPKFPYIPNNGTINNLEDIKPTIPLRNNLTKAPSFGVFGLFGDIQGDLAELLLPLAGKKYAHLGLKAIPDREMQDFYWQSLYAENDIRKYEEGRKALELVRTQMQKLLLKKVSIKYIEDPDTPNVRHYNKKNKKINHGYKFEVLDDFITL